MKKTHEFWGKCLYLLPLYITLSSCEKEANAGQEADIWQEIDFNFGRRFNLMEDSATNASTVDFNDNDCRNIR